MFKRLTGEILTVISWLAPTQNVDGTDIDYELAYQLYVNGAPTLTFPGTLNPDGRYTFPLADVPALDTPGEYTLTLTAFDASDQARESEQSGPLVIVRLPANPLPPSDVEGQ